MSVNKYSLEQTNLRVRKKISTSC